MEVLNVNKTPTVLTSDNKRTWNSLGRISKGSAQIPSPRALELSRLNHLGRRSFTSVVIAPQRWFKPASLSFKKLPSVGESFCTIPSPALFSAAKLGWWLPMPSSSSCDRDQLKINSTSTLNCSEVMNPPRYHWCGVNLSVRETKPWKDILRI